MRQRGAFGAWIEQPLAPVMRARARLDEPPVKQWLEHAVETLLGDFENVEQSGYGEARPAIDEMQHPMMRPAEIIVFQQPVSVFDEISIGEEKQFHHLEYFVAFRRDRFEPLLRLGGILRRRRVGRSFCFHSRGQDCSPRKMAA